MKPQEKLKLEHIAPYLPYKLMICQDSINEIKAYPLEGLQFRKNTSEPIVFIDDKNYGSSYIKGIKPILKPLSSLTDKEIKKYFNDNDIDIVRTKFSIVINYKLMGEWFKEVVPLIKVLQDENSNLVMSAWLYLKLVKNHYDVFGLIPKGLAIDINQLKLTDN